ncbi:MAG: nitrate/nitrite transporter NrtS [Salinivirgaceae bacterium]|nr:nitrate/nitrite transporter NrtS [Salinivirgaceae bacterium]
MRINLVKLFFKLAIDSKVVNRSKNVALIVGIVLNAINQWEALFTLNLSGIDWVKFLLTFMVPYLVSTYSSVMAKLTFQVGEIAPINAILRCKKCSNKVIHINKGEIVPECDQCPTTKWIIIEKGVSRAKSFEDNKESMAFFAEYNPAPVFRFDYQGTVLMSNPAANEFFSSDIVGVDVHTLAREFVSVKFNEVIDKGQIRSFVEKIGNKTMRFEFRGIPMLGVCQVYGADISEVLEARLDNIRLSTAIEQSSNSIMITNTKGNIMFVNKAFENVTGYTKNEAMGKNPRFLKTDHLPNEAYENLWKTIAKGDVWKGEFHNMKKDGTTYWEEATISPIKNEDGETINYMAVKEDVTAQKEIKNELNSMALFAMLNPEPVFRFNPEGVVIKSNPAANESFGKDSIVGLHIIDLLPKCSDLDIESVIKNAAIETAEENVGERIYRLLMRGLPELNVLQVYGSDITARKKAEEEIRVKNEHIAQSIRYASRIQDAVLPPKSKIEDLVPEHFIFFRPRDIVSGDFYWMARNNNKLIISAVDCTGHGVPGAFMSMLGISFLNEIASKNNEEPANEILNKLRVIVKSTLSSSGTDARDGMDMALCVIDYDSMKMQYAGANNPLYFIRNKELNVIKADKMPIGHHLREKASFTNHEFEIKKGDVFYIFSDGYVDQFGGDRGRKFSSKGFKELVLSIHDKPMATQYEIIAETFDNWKGEQSQIDDVLIIGGKI